MSSHKAMDRICGTVLVFTLLIALLFCGGERFGMKRASAVSGYEARLFDTARVHTVDIVMDDWEGFLETCENEEYQKCTVVIDQEEYKNVALRAKGNTSLSMVKSYGNNRYSFKIEFDHYDAGNTYYGLDKLCLNNIIQDNTYMKDYLAYTLMREAGVPSPLCSYVYITVNGQEWGLYLAVEAIEDAFLTRTYGKDHGRLYKPDSMGFGGGRGNGGDFRMSNLDFENMPQPPEGFPEQPWDSSDEMEGAPPQDFADRQAGDGSPDETRQRGKMGGGPGGGMGSSDVKLQYIDDDPDSYSNVFENAKTDITKADQTRLIASLKKLSEQEDLETIVQTEEVIRYFVVHNFLCNDDSYTGSMVHNYYLYEEDGQLSMLPWDYNLSFGGFSAGRGSADGTDTVNTPIDSLVSGGSLEDRPMAAWIFSDEKYTALYHQYYSEFLQSAQEGLADTIAQTAALIAPYVEKDPTKFCTMEEFETGVDTLQTFCALRLESIHGQLEGTIPSTTDGQQQDSSSLIDASGITISDMGSMNGGGEKGGFGGGRPGADSPGRTESTETEPRERRTARTVNVADEKDGFGQPPSFGDGEMPGMERQPETQPDSRLWLLISVAVLLIGLLFAWRVKR